MTDELMRGVSAIYPSAAALDQALADGRKRRIYFGIDPTGPDIHLGHAIPLRKLRQFQDLGHQAILLIGDFTALIGDPTGKTAARPQLSPEQARGNSKNYLAQAWKILDEKKTEVRHNSEWLAKLSFTELLKLTSRLTFAQIIKRDMFQRRLNEGKDLFLHEFLYPLMQGYDSVALDVDMEIGGNDQIFNMLVGRDLLKSLKNKEKFVLATKLLAAPGEAKMSKTEGRLVTLGDAPADMYGKMMSWPDGVLPLAFELCSTLPTAVYEKILVGHPRDAKMRLAKEIVTLYHGRLKAAAAEKNFVNTFQKGEAPEEWEEVTGNKGQKLADILVAAGAVKSKSEFRRLVAEKAIHLWPQGAVSDPDAVLEAPLRLKVGKKKFVRLKINH